MTKHNEGLGVVGWSRGGGIGLGLGVDSSSLVCDIGDISIIAVGRVLDMLDTSIGKSNRVGAGNVGGTIGLLGGVEVGLGVVISHGVGELVGRHLSKVISNISGLHGGVVSGGVVDNGGVDKGGGVDNGGVVNDGGVVNHGGVEGSGVVNSVDSMGNNTVRG